MNINSSFDTSSDENIEKYVKRELKIRTGQGAYRTKLLKDKHCKCELCSVNIKELLYASHIKPWKDCTQDEAYNENNGLLLCATHDSLFDKGFISFNNDGTIEISSLLNEELLKDLNISKNIKIHMNDKEKRFMKYHKKHVFKN